MLMRQTSRFISIVEKLKGNVNTAWTGKASLWRWAFSYRMTGRDKREGKRIIFEYFEYVESEWDKFQKKKR
jgi:hypothetical protein